MRAFAAYAIPANVMLFETLERPRGQRRDFRTLRPVEAAPSKS
jgi:hypothetical protein